MSFSDIMSALLVIFVLASVILILQLMEKQKELEQREIRFDREITQLKHAETVRRTIIDEIVEELRKRGVKVQASENRTVLHISNEQLGFDSAVYNIQERYRQTALNIGAVINQVISQDERVGYLDTVFVEGHTDSQKYFGLAGKGNWGLSTFRAISLWQLWETDLPDMAKLSRFSNKDGEPLFSVSGYADTRAVNQEQDTDEGRRQNRRIDIRFTIRRPQSKEYEEVRRTLEEPEQ